MSCSSFRGSWEIGDPEGHAASCAACAGWVASRRRAAAALAHLAAALDGAVVPDDREAAWRAAFRQATRPASTPESRRWLWALAVTAACLLIAVVLAARGGPRTAPHVQVAARPSPTNAPPPAIPGPPDTAPAERPATRPPASRTHHEAPPGEAPVAAPEVAPPAANAIATSREPLPAGPAEESLPGIPERLADGSAASAPGSGDRSFYALVPDLEAASLESGQIVRVQLRQDVLEAAGLPPRSVPHDPVEAEVLVGPDGVARGIRLAGPRR
jgi:hypothetical protein